MGEWALQGGLLRGSGRGPKVGQAHPPWPGTYHMSGGAFWGSVQQILRFDPPACRCLPYPVASCNALPNPRLQSCLTGHTTAAGWRSPPSLCSWPHPSPSPSSAQVRFVSPWDMHNRVANMYTWDDVARRTEVVYNKVRPPVFLPLPLVRGCRQICLCTLLCIRCHGLLPREHRARHRLG